MVKKMTLAPIELEKLLSRNASPMRISEERYDSIFAMCQNSISRITSEEIEKIRLVAKSSKTIESVLKKIAIMDKCGDFYQNTIKLCAAVEFIQKYTRMIDCTIHYEELEL